MSLTVKPYWCTAASRDWRLTGISTMGGARQRGLQSRPSQAGKWIHQLPWHSTTGICLDRTIAVIMPSSSPKRQQQLSVIRKYALARSATLRDLLACPRGPHQSTTAAAPTKKKKAATASLLSTLLSLVADRVTSPDGDVASARRSQWNISWMASEPRSVAHPLHPFTPPPKRAIKEAKMATTGPPSLTGHNISSEWPQAISCACAVRHQRQPPCQWHSGWLPCVGTLPGPLPKTLVTSPGPDQGTGPRQVSATLPKVCGVESCWWPPCHPGGRLQGRGRGLWQQCREQWRK